MALYSDKMQVQDPFVVFLIFLLITAILLLIYHFCLFDGDFSSIHYVDAGDRRANVVPVENPFRVNYNEGFKNASEIELIISSKVEFVYCSFWTHSPNLADNLLNRSQEEKLIAIRSLMQNPSSFSECSCEPSFISVHDLWNAKRMSFSPCCEVMDQGADFFSFLITKDEFSQLGDDPVIGMLYVYCIEKVQNNLELKIWNRYTIFSNGDISCMMKVFTPGPISPEGENMFSCTVCLAENAPYVIIPCRHACACTSCLHELNMCPVCRGPIQYYFPLVTDTPTLNA